MATLAFIRPGPHLRIVNLNNIQKSITSHAGLGNADDRLKTHCGDVVGGDFVVRRTNAYAV